MRIKGEDVWIPAFAGMTRKDGMTEKRSKFILLGNLV